MAMLPATAQAALSPSSSPPASLLVVGLGNPILGDDGVGWKVAEEVARRLKETGASTAPSVRVECLSLGGLSLMEQLIGCRRAILVDACAVDLPPGTVFTAGLDELPDRSGRHTSSAHDASLQTAMAVGRAMGEPLPEEVTLVGIASEALYEFSEVLTPEVAASIPEAAQRVLDLIFTGGVT